MKLLSQFATGEFGRDYSHQEVSSLQESSLKRARLARSMTLKGLSELTGLSQAFISEVENGKANPTIDTLRRLAKGLGVSLFDILSEEESFVDIVRARERRVVNASEYNVDYELVSTLLPSAKSQVVMAWLYPEASTSDQPQSHGAPGDEEIAVVVTGTITITLNEAVYMLNEGDSIRFNPYIPHSYKNAGSTRAGLLTVMTPPSF